MSHGSRDPRPQAAAQYLARLVLQQLDSPEVRYLLAPGERSPKNFWPIAGTATLELATLPLHQSIEQFALRARASGFSEVAIVPLFLHAGVHVIEDLPTAVERARAALDSSIALHLLPHVGSYQGILPLLAEQFERWDTPGRILLAHGSRRAQGNDAIAAMADRLNARAAYWSVAPGLREQVTDLAALGAIAIVPYFLFAGDLTEAITAEIQQLQGQFPNTPLHLGQPLGVTPALAASIAEVLASWSFVIRNP